MTDDLRLKAAQSSQGEQLDTSVVILWPPLEPLHEHRRHLSLRRLKTIQEKPHG